MKPFGLALTVTLISSAACPVSAGFSTGPLAGPADAGTGPLVRLAAYGDPPGPGRRHGGRKARVSKSAEPGLPSTKGLNQEDADKQYRKKYGF